MDKLSVQIETKEEGRYNELGHNTESVCDGEISTYHPNKHRLPGMDVRSGIVERHRQDSR